MRIGVYNQMFGLNGRSFLETVYGHYLVHFQNDSSNIWKRTDLSKTVEIIKKSRADVIGICEILQGQEKELARKLKKIGYKWIYFGEGHRTRFRKLHIKVAIASKIRCKKEYIQKEPIENKMGGGGGIVDCYFPGLKLNILNVHLGLRKKLRKNQLEFLREHLKRREKFVLMGDFNSCYNDISGYFSNLELDSDRIKTCTLTPFLRFFSWRDCDHILSRGLKKKDTGFLEGYSDHRLIYADFTLK